MSHFQSVHFGATEFGSSFKLGKRDLPHAAAEYVVLSSTRSAPCVYNGRIASPGPVKLGGNAVIRFFRLATMVALWRGCAAVLIGATSLGVLAAADVPMTGAHADAGLIEKLIRELGHERFSTREAASDRLARIGLPAFAALEEASRASDREVRFRAERILNLIRKNDLERRLAAFIAGTGKDDYELPAWDRFQKAYGDTEVSRKLFVEMQRAEPELLAAFHRDPRGAVEILGRRLAERIPTQVRGVNVNPATASPAEVSAYLFVAANQDAPVTSTSLTVLLGLCSRMSFGETSRLSKDGDLGRKMLASVIRRCDADSLPYAIDLAMRLEMKEGLVPAVKMLEQNARPNPNVPQQYSAMALCCVAEFGDGSHVAAVENLLKDERVLTTSTSRQVRGGETTTQMKELQIRDVALATLVVLTKQDGKEYFGQPIPPRPPSTAVNPFNRFPVQIVGFEKVVDAQKPHPRALALEKWENYKARQQKEKPGDVQPAGGQAPIPAEGAAKPEKPADR